MKGQSEEAKKERLFKGDCPIHGLSMSQVGNMDEYSIVACPRMDCGKQYLSSGMENNGDLNKLREYSELILRPYQW